MPNVDHRLLRSRLVLLLRQRFERRLVTVTAPAGYGKTTALAQALEQNALDPAGIDVWLSVGPHDDAQLLFGRIVAELTSSAGRAEDPLAEADLDAVCDAVLAQAPRDVALIFDDVHFASDNVAQSISALVEDLPANGHIVVAGRTKVVEGDARLASAGEVLRIDVEELAFSAEEVHAICQVHGVTEVLDLGVEARWPAQLSLGLRGDRSTQAQYLAEELIADMLPDRRDKLAQLAALVAADDALASRVTDSAIRSVEDVVSGLPLVDRFDNGSVRLHDLWVEALRPYLPDERRAQLRAEAARALIDDGRFVDAMRMAFEAGDFDLFERAAHHEARRPQTEASLVAIRQCIDMIAHTDLRALTLYFKIHEEWCLRGPAGLAERLLDVADIAAADGDQGFEAFLLYRTVQALADQTVELGSLPDRVFGLTEHSDPDVSWTQLHLETLIAMRSADVNKALVLLEDFYTVAGPLAVHFHAMFFTDLGRPERVTGDPFRDDFGVSRGRAASVELFVAQAAWLCGVAPPELALEFGAGLAARTRDREVRSQLLAQIAVFVIIAAGAGDQDRVDELLSRIDQTDVVALGARQATFAHIAPAVAAAAAGHEQEATAHLERARALSGLHPWPFRSWFYALVPAYVLLPDSRTDLANLDLGPTLCSVIDAGKALVAMRDDRSVAAIPELPWTNGNVLRAHIPVAMLVELCVGGHLANVTEATTLLGEIPNAGVHLRRVADRYNGKISTQARALAQKFPVPPAAHVTVRVCGPIQLLRDGELVEDPTWRRARVQELLAFLVVNPRMRRSTVAASIWPDLDEDAAMNSLRVHLSLLSKVLQPDKERGAPPWFVRSEGDSLTLAPGLLDCDINKLVHASDEAVAADQAGLPSQAIEGYRQVVSLYRGELLESHEAAWLDIDRLDIRGRAVTAHVRLGELALATGEPEQARDAARRALAAEPNSQRGARLFVRATRGTGDLAGAQALAATFTQRILDAGVPIDIETARVFRA